MTESNGQEGNSVLSSFKIRLGAPGVYDPDKQLSGEQVVELKNRLLSDPELVEKVASHITNNLMKKFRDCNANWFETEEEWQDYGNGTKRSWVEGLALVIETPGIEWPRGLSPAATFAEALQEIDHVQKS